MGMFDLFRRRATGGPDAMHARLEGAMAKRRLRGWNPPLENINALVASGGPRLLARSRELVVTNGYAANACEAFAANLVGDGIKPSSLITDAALRDHPPTRMA
jgi:capsid protein